MYVKRSSKQDLFYFPKKLFTSSSISSITLKCNVLQILQNRCIYILLQQEATFLNGRGDIQLPHSLEKHIPCHCINSVQSYLHLEENALQQLISTLSLMTLSVSLPRRHNYRPFLQPYLFHKIKCSAELV